MEEENTNNGGDEKERRENIIECGIVETSNSRARIRSLNIIGTIEGHNLLPSGTKTTKYEHVLPQLVAVEEDDGVEGLLILLNTVGGDVEAGLAIAEAAIPSACRSRSRRTNPSSFPLRL